MLSVVIPTKFERKNLQYCIKSINNQILKPDEILIIATSKETKKIKEFEENFDLKVYIEKRQGLSYSRNLGVLKSKGDIIAFIDDDAIAHKKWLYYISKSHKLKEIGIVGGKIKPIWPKHVSQIIKNSILAREWLSLLDLGKFPFYVDRVIGSNFSLKREVFNQIGAFNTSIGKYQKLMYGGEETEFCERAGKKFKILYSPKALVYHKVSAEKLKLKWFIKRSFDSGFNKAKMKRVPKVLARNPRFNLFDYALMFPYLMGYFRAKISNS
ncbi:MAG: glycosyltransferase [Candidatus Helarchaeota archaeon]|nr:glycosyltransferase [Candidatus Helarchaeota archaeon]